MVAIINPTHQTKAAPSEDREGFICVRCTIRDVTGTLVCATFTAGYHLSATVCGCFYAKCAKGVCLFKDEDHISMTATGEMSTKQCERTVHMLKLCMFTAQGPCGVVIWMACFHDTGREASSWQSGIINNTLCLKPGEPSQQELT